VKQALASLPAYGSAARGDWPLAPDVHYLNHGGYGVAPHDVLAVQAEWRARIERDPTRFMVEELPGAWRQAAEVLARHLGATGEDLVFVENATVGCNAVLRSLDLHEGDEILVTGLGYAAINKAARYAASRSGAKVVEVAIPMPVPDMAALTAAIAARLGPRTRLCIFDHIVSPAALVLPVAELSYLAHGAGARVLIDGAHAPGQIALDIPAIGADWYVGNCHKWLMAPRACGFLWAAPAAQAGLHPLAISHGLGEGFHAEFDWTGTRDPSPMLAVPAAIATHQRMGGEALMARNAALARDAARLLCDAWHSPASGPEDAFAAMVSVRLPPGPATREDALSLQRRLVQEHRLSVPIMAFAGALWVRIAAQAYNELAEYEHLARALHA
jgi:isopenicillin-N epimerase